VHAEDLLEARHVVLGLVEVSLEPALEAGSPALSIMSGSVRAIWLSA
jgi:hypothetical protein